MKNKILKFFFGEKVNIGNIDTRIAGALNVSGVSGVSSIKDIRKMLEDDEISSCLEVRMTALYRCDYYFEGLTEKQVISVENKLFDIIDCLFNSLVFGFSVTQVVPLGGDDFLVIKEKPEDFNVVDEDNVFAEIENKTVNVIKEFPRADNNTFFHVEFYKRDRNNPLGRSVLKELIDVVDARKNSFNLWLRFIDRFSMPWVWVKSRGGNLEEIANSVYNAVKDAVIATGVDVEINFLQAKSDDGAHERLLGYIDRRIQRKILGQNLTVEVKSGGSFAAAKVHELVRRDKLVGDIVFLQGAMSRLLSKLFKRNIRVVIEIPVEDITTQTNVLQGEKSGGGHAVLMKDINTTFDKADKIVSFVKSELQKDFKLAAKNTKDLREFLEKFEDRVKNNPSYYLAAFSTMAEAEKNAIKEFENDQR